jgi:hypothetical protein
VVAWKKGHKTGVADMEDTFEGMRCNAFIIDFASMPFLPVVLLPSFHWKHCQLPGLALKNAYDSKQQLAFNTWNDPNASITELSLMLPVGGCN